MKLMITRMVIAGLIVVSVVFGIIYYVNAPDPAMSTYNAISKLMQKQEYEQFHEKLLIMSESYVPGAAVNTYYVGVEEALDNNFNYYKGYLLFVGGVTQNDQSYINTKIKAYQTAFFETNEQLIHFNKNLALSSAIKKEMHDNFIEKYNAQIKIYSELVDALKNYVIKYAFSGAVPVGLKQTLLQVQLDYVNVVITQKLDAITSVDTLYNELTTIKQKFASFENKSQGSNAQAALFIEAYESFEDKFDYLNSLEKAVYIATYSQGLERSYLETIHNFLMQESYN